MSAAEEPQRAPKRRYITDAVLSALEVEFPEFDVPRARDDYLNYGPNLKHVDQVKGLRNQLTDPERNWRFRRTPNAPNEYLPDPTSLQARYQLACAAMVKAGRAKSAFAAKELLPFDEWRRAEFGDERS